MTIQLLNLRGWLRTKSVIIVTDCKSKDVSLISPSPKFPMSFSLRSTATIAILTMIIVAIAKCFTIGSYFISSFLYQDDTIFVGAAYQGSPLENPHSQSLYYGLIELLVSIGGLFGSKLLLVLMPALSCLFMFLIIRSFTRSAFVAAMLSVFVTLYPIDPAQSYFLTGAHPTAGLTVFMAVAFFYLQLLKGQIEWPRWRSSLYFLTCCAGLYVTTRSSPTFVLAPLLLLPISATILWKNRSQLNLAHLVYVMVPLALWALIYFFGGDYHYSELVGWTDISMGRSLSNLAGSLAHIFQDPFRYNAEMLLPTSLGVLLFGVCLIKLMVNFVADKGIANYPASDNRWPFLLFLLLAAVLTYGPGSVTTNYLPRYTIVPFQIGCLFLSILIATVFEHAQNRTESLRFAGLCALCIMTGTAFVHASQINHSRLSPLLKTHTKIVDELGRRNWSDEDQILIQLAPGERESTGGYNHWSTWYLRTVTQSRGLIGLVGDQRYEADLQANGLFVDAYEDHGPAFWSVSNGVSRRYHMLGLTRDRPTYAYVVRNGALVLLPLRLVWGEDMKVLQPGQRFADIPSTAQESTRCELGGSSDVLTVNIDKSPAVTTSVQAPRGRQYGPIPENTVPQDVIPSPFVATGDTERFLVIENDPSGSTSIHIELSGAPGGAAQEYSNTYPEMPLLAPGFAVYLRGDEYVILERENQRRSFSSPVDTNQATRIDIIDCGPGRSSNALYLDGVYQGLFSSDVVYGQWRIGAGLGDRYWDGEISRFQTRQSLP